MKKLITTLLSLVLVAMPLATFAQSASYPASMSFSGVANNQVVIGQNFTVNVVVNTGGQNSSGADVVVEYDPTEVTYVSINQPTTQSNFYPNIIMQNPIQQNVGSKKTLELARAQYGGAGALPTNGIGIFVQYTFTPLGQVGDTITLDFDFDGTGETIDSNVTSAATVTDLLGAVSSATYILVAAAPVANNPTINSISPSSGNKDISQNITIFGANFGTAQGAGWVHIGTKSASIVSWADSQIMITVPAEGDLTSNSARRIKVQRNDGKQVNYDSYTYIVTPLVPTGPEELMWAGIVLAALGMSMLAYRKMNYVANVETSMPVDDLTNIMSPKENSDSDNISYRF